jgi:iron transport multicopper oxidase
MDGLRGPLIINDPNNPYKGQYDSEIIMWVSDWYHEQATKMIPYYVEVDLNPTPGSEPVPQSALFNDQMNPTFSVTAGKTYYLRLINMSGFAQFYFHIDNHTFTIIEADGVYMKPAPAGDLYIATGQRYGALLKTQPNSNKNYAILAAMDTDKFDPSALALVPDIRPNVTGTLVYNCKK